MNMYRDNKMLITLICALLSVAILIASVFPVHIHLHHDDSAGHSAPHHVIDRHSVHDDFGASHHQSSDYHEVAAAPEAITKVFQSVSFDQVLLTLLGILLASVFLQIRGRTTGAGFTPLSSYCHLRPPLRAPPL